MQEYKIVFHCSDLDVDMSHACMHIFRRFRNTAKKSIASSRLSVCLCMEEITSHWTGFY
jgi:hypothetical protein